MGERGDWACEIVFNPKIKGYLDALAKTGLYGEDYEEVAYALVLIGLRGAMADGILPPPPDIVLDPACGGPSTLPQSYKCDLCKDGLVEPEDGAIACPKCGHDFIPF